MKPSSRVDDKRRAPLTIDSTDTLTVHAVRYGMNAKNDDPDQAKQTSNAISMREANRLCDDVRVNDADELKRQL